MKIKLIAAPHRKKNQKTNKPKTNKKQKGTTNKVRVNEQKTERGKEKNKIK